MATIQQHCDAHRQRRAIGVCVVTGKAICAECSTRYEGVNYSREGLEWLKAQRAQQAAGGRTGERAFGWMLALLVSPLLVLMLYGFFWIAMTLLIDIGQLEAS